MKKMLLTSIGVNTPNFKEDLLKILKKPINETKIILISESKDDSISIYYLGIDIKGLVDIGFNLNNIKIFSLTQDQEINFEEYDIIFVCGGNTFHYLKLIKQKGLDIEIIKQVNNGKIYIGESAGSIIVTSTIETSNIGDEPDINDIELKDLKGLNLVDFLISPHYVESEEEQIKQLEKKLNIKIVRLTDSQSILINED